MILRAKHPADSRWFWTVLGNSKWLSRLNTVGLGWATWLHFPLKVVFGGSGYGSRLFSEVLGGSGGGS